MLEQYVDSLLLGIERLSPLLIFGFFFLSGFLQIAFPIYPGDTVLIFGGCLGGLAMQAKGVLALSGYLSATVVTSLLLYELGYRLNERIFRIKFIAGIVPLAKRNAVEGEYKKFGAGLLAVCKFIPGVNSLVILLGGVLHYPRTVGMTAIAVSSVLHNVFFYYVGHLLGKNLGAIKSFIREYTLITAIIFLLACIAAALWYFIQKRKGNGRT